MLLFAIKEKEKWLCHYRKCATLRSSAFGGSRSRTPPQTQMQEYVEYTKYQWVLYNDFKAEVQNGNYGAYYQFLIEELDMGPYWSDVKFYYGQVHEEEEPETSDS